MAKKFNITNEQLVLVSLIKNEQRIKFINLISINDFIGEKHKTIFQSIKICIDNNLDLSIQNIAVNCENEFGGKEYLKKLFSLKSDNTGFYIKKLLEESKRRKVLLELDEIRDTFEDKDISFKECQQRIKEVNNDLEIDTIDEGFYDINKWYDNFKLGIEGKKKHFVSTGFDSLDECMSEGFFKGGVTVIAARTSVGKSTFVRDIVYRKRFVKKDDSKILVVQQEGSVDSVLDSLVADICEIDLFKMIKYSDQLSRQERRKIFQAKIMIEKDDNLKFMNNPFIRLLAKSKSKNDIYLVYNKMRDLFFSNDFDIIVFDLWERSLFRIDQAIITVALTFFQDFCRESKIHGIIVQQLSRKVMDRKLDRKRRPNLGDLKNSGAYEEFADNVILLHRERLFQRFIKDDIIEINIAKQRRGQANILCIGDFEPQYSRIVNDKIADMEDFGIVGPSMLKEKEK